MSKIVPCERNDTSIDFIEVETPKKSRRPEFKKNKKVKKSSLYQKPECDNIGILPVFLDHKKYERTYLAI